MADPDLHSSTSSSVASSPSAASALSSPKHHHLKQQAVVRGDSVDSVVDSPEKTSKPDNDDNDKRRLSLQAETISFNFVDGNFDSQGAYKALSVPHSSSGGEGSTSPSSGSSLKTLSFHSAKELEEYIEGYGDPESDEDEGGGGGGGTPGNGVPGLRPPLQPSPPGTPRGNSDGKNNTMRSLRSMWTATLGRGASSSAEVMAAAAQERPPKPSAEDATAHQGDLEFEESGGEWKTRTWVLTGTKLGYEKKPGNFTLKGAGGRRFKPVFEVRDIARVFHDPSCFIVDEHCFVVETGKKKKHFFKAASRADMVTWMVAIAKQRRRSGSYV